MGNAADRGIELDELERAVKAADPAARLVRPRILRRVIKHDRGLTGLGLQVPHRQSYVIDAGQAAAIVDPEEVGLGPGEELPAKLILLARPDPGELAARPAGAALLRCWRLLFHARVHLALGHKLAEGSLTPRGVRRRIHRIGQAEFDEIRAVLRQEDYLLPPRDDLTVYTEFAAVYLELRHFAEHLLPRYFPALRDLAAIDRLLAEDVDAEGLFAATRPPGAPLPEAPAEDEAAFYEDEDVDAAPEPPDEALPPQRPSRRSYWGLMQRADGRRERGNLVRAAILRTRAARVAPLARLAGKARTTARDELERLARRLAVALGLDDAGAREWLKATAPLLERAVRGRWTAEGRLLYDLQKVCVDHERPVYVVDPVGWALSLGRRPMKRLLPHHREVLTVKHLRSASRRLRRVRIADADRQRLGGLLLEAVEGAEEGLRHGFRPRIARTLRAIGLRPAHRTERVALRKLIEELLDRVVERGFLTMGDLRDAISRNNLKVPDLSGPREFLGGDHLLRANRRLAVTLDGVYHPAEIYLRGLQRMTSLAFGTPLGRFLTLYVVLPFGGAFVLLEGVQHLIDPLVYFLEGFDVHLLTPVSFAFTGCVALGLIHSRDLRQLGLRLVRAAWRAVRWLAIDLPAWVLNLPPIRWVRENLVFRLMWRWTFKPLAVTAAAWALLPEARSGLHLTLAEGAATFLAATLVLNSRLGRNAEEIAVDWLVRQWRRIHLDLLPGLYRLIMGTFDRMLELTERLLYTVDEWLRFRGGDPGGWLVSKVVLAAFWFVVVYVVRFFVVLVAEPQLNPIKHFPVVTVSHKLMVPLVVPLPRMLRKSPLHLSRWTARAIAAALQFIIPGICGFLVWELKENWRLYRANRPGGLRPVAIGHHGETMARLLRPGFHSGTLPKLYAKWRQAEARAARAGRPYAGRKHREALHHVQKAIRHFVERDFLALLRESQTLAPLRVGVGGVVAGSNRILIELCRGEGPRPEGLWIGFEEQSGWLVAGIAQPGWLPTLSGEQRQALATAIAGLYKMAGVDLVREQIAASFGPPAPSYDVADSGLVVWPGPEFDAQAVYDLRDGPALPPRTTDGPLPAPLPVLDADRLLFRRVPIPWRLWVAAWDRDRAGDGHPDGLLDGLHLLPRPPDAPDGTED
ncbi:MAG TPA: hypothetical protein VF590_12655 [Isosphaeraceae bacterium]|jgi:hypothetical protein